MSERALEGPRRSGEAATELQQLVKARQRVIDHGEVFTPSWLVDDMLDLVGGEAERIDSRILEPACGSGNFLVSVLLRKLASVHEMYAASDFEKRHHALLALMSLYGIELLQDNAEECRTKLINALLAYVDARHSDDLSGAAQVVVHANIVQGDALDMTTVDGEPITFPEWGYIGKGQFQRRDFRFEALTHRSSIDGTLFSQLEEHELFIPIRTYPPMTMTEIGR